MKLFGLILILAALGIGAFFVVLSGSEDDNGIFGTQVDDPSLRPLNTRRSAQDPSGRTINTQRHGSNPGGAGTTHTGKEPDRPDPPLSTSPTNAHEASASQTNHTDTGTPAVTPSATSHEQSSGDTHPGVKDHPAETSTSPTGTSHRDTHPPKHGDPTDPTGTQAATTEESEQTAGSLDVAEQPKIPGLAKAFADIPEWDNGAEPRCMAISPDGSYGLTGNTSGSIRIWDFTTGKVRHELSGHDGWVGALAFGADGSTFASIGYDGVLRIWQATDGTLKQSFKTSTNSAIALALSADGLRAIASSQDQRGSEIYNLSDGSLLGRLAGHDTASSQVALSPDGTLAVTKSFDRTIKGWDVTTRKELWRASDAEPKAALFIGAGASGSDTAILLSNAYVSNAFPVCASFTPAATGSGMRILGSKERPSGTPLGFAAGGQETVTHARDGITIWSTASGEALRKIPGTPVQAVLARNAPFLFVSQGGQLGLWNIASGLELSPSKRDASATLDAHRGPVTDLQFVANDTLYSASSDGTIRRWDLATSSVRERFEDEVLKAVALGDDKSPIFDFSARAQVLTAGSYSGQIISWNTASGSELRVSVALSSAITALALSPDGSRTLSCHALADANQPYAVRLWDTATGELILEFPAPKERINGAVFVNDFSIMLFTSAGKLQEWSATGSMLREFGVTGLSHPYRFEHAISSRFLAVEGRDGHVRVYDLATAARVVDVAHMRRNTWAHALAIHPAGKMFAAGCNDADIRVWSIPEGKLLHTFHGHQDAVIALDFSPDGSLLASGSKDKALMLWNIEGAK